MKKLPTARRSRFDRPIPAHSHVIQELLGRLRRRDIRVWAEGDRLRFNAPRGAMTPELQEDIASNKDAILRFLGSVAQGEESSPPIEKASRDEPLPLSYAQQRVWFLQKFDPKSPAYNVPAEVVGNEHTRPDVLARALGELLKRHEILRTRVVTREGEPFQVVEPYRPVTLPVVDLTSLDGDDWVRETGRLAREEAGRPFDLERGPLVRFFYLERYPDTPVLVLTQHHIVTDRWSLGLLARELSALHRRLQGGESDDLPELPVQYPDFALWQRRWLEGPLLEKQLAYWKPQLEGALPVLSLPTDRPRPKARTYRGAWRWLELGKDLSEQVKQLSRDSGVTLFNTLLAAFYVLLHRYSRETDISVGTPVTGRSRKELENLIGLFVNTLVLRCDLSGEPSFRELLVRVRSVALDAFSHADMPFEKLVEALQPERDESRSPLFQVMFVLQNAPASVEVERIDAIFLRASGATMFDMTLTVSESAEGLTATCEYATDLFDASTIDRMLSHYRRLLEAVLLSPDVPVGELALLGDDERRLGLTVWNDTDARFPEDATLHALFEEKAREAPSDVAVVAGEAILTYEELDFRSNRLARKLRSLGVARGTLVGVSLPRSVDIPVALFGILKAGGAYVPLDPHFPESRLRFMEQDSRLALRIDAGWLDSERESLERESPEPLPAAATADDLAYVIYTSGSTGMPKGVAVSHRSVVNFLTSMRRQPGLSPADVLLSVTTLSFDIAGLELYLPLTTGARVVLASAEAALDARELSRLIENAGATVLQATPATWRLLLDGGWQGREGLRMLCGGEALTRELARELLSLGGPLWNLYGPTETTIWSAIHRVESTENGVPIGRPIANTRMYVVDERLELVPAGVVGELVIGGEGVARGYLGRPDLTADRFVPDPFAAKPGERLYRTGDLARFRADGTFECLGRKDQQVKVRGFRVELSEIESALLEHEGVREAIVVAREAPEGRRLAAFVTVSGPTLVTAALLRGHLRERLPAYMVPGHFATLEALPLTPNGKVDRRALAERREDEPHPETLFEAPRTPIEESVSEVFRQILGMRNVSIHDNFFELGGHSLLATQVISRLMTRFGVEIPLRLLFAGPTVAALAAVVVDLIARREGNGVEVQAIRRVDRSAGVFPLSFAQQRYWFLDQLEPGNPAYNIHLPLVIHEAVDREALAKSLDAVVRRHESLRTSFGMLRGEPVSRIAAPGSFTLAEVNLEHLPESQKEVRAAEEASRLAVAPFDLTRAPLFRAGLFRLGPERSVLSIVTHHVVCDRWSLGIILKEILVLYAAFRSGAPSPLPELPIQYVDFAAWQRSFLAGDVLDRQLSFWKTTLAGRLPVLELPTDRPRPQIQTFAGSTRSRRLSRTLRDDLERLGQSGQATLFMTVLAGFTVLLHRYTGERDVLVGSPVANRTRPEVEPVVGFFANTLVLRTSLEGDPTFRELVSRVRETALDAFAHQDLPFEKLVEELRPERNLGQNPLFQVLFTFQSPSAPAKVRRNEKLDIFPVESRTAQFDLSAYLDDTSHGLVVTFEFNTDLFDAGTIERMLSHFEELLTLVRRRPELRVSEISILTENERRALVEVGDGGPAPIAAELAHQLFSERAAREPDAVALEFEGEKLSYRELDARANRLAHWLRARGVGRETVVGVAVEPSFDLVASLLAVLKAGGAYLPLDPAFPTDRLRLMLEDSRAALVLTTESLKASLPRTAAELVALDAEPFRRDLTNLSADSPNVSVDFDNLAYVIYTSGSTGRPKGVQVPHGALASFLAAMRSEPGLAPEDALLSVTTFSFDIAALEIFLPLVTGARLVLVARDVTRDGRALLRAAHDSGATVLQATPATFQLLVEAGWSRNGFSLRALSGGEALAPDLAAGLLERSAAVFNLYGPTETTIWSMAKRLSAEDPRVTLGGPIAGTRVYLLDSDLQLVPPGVPGEIAIAGEGVTRGYFGQPDRTAERFLPDPFAATPGERMYRTGDLARRRADGEIEYLGRNDFQVKVRGFRIELGDVETALRDVAGVRAAVVLARQAAGGSTALVAYLVYDPVSAPTVTELRAALKEKLPLYMVPSAFVSVDALPLTPNGKVDRRALEKAEREEARGTAHVEPRSAMERLVASIWRDVLERKQVSLHDNFFDLGGHSLLSMKVVARLEDEIGERVNPRELIFQTLEQFAAACEAQRRRRGDDRTGLLGKVVDRLKGLAPRMR